ncbi:MAG: cytochrome c peroxidase [Chitinophagaceae bacterium]
MFRYKSFFLLALTALSIALISMSLKKTSGRSKAVEGIVLLYNADIQRFDSLLQQYPKYYNDSSYELRRFKFRELTFQLKRIEGLFTYFHPDLAYQTLLKTPQFEARDFGPPFPDNWLIIGPFGIDPDSVLKKTTKADSAFTRKFIERAVNNFSRLLRETDIAGDIAAMTDADVFEALRLQMVRISTIGLANGDFVVEEAGLASFRGQFSAWADMMRLVTLQLPHDQTQLKNTILQKLDKGERLLQNQEDLHAFDRMNFLTVYLMPLSRMLKKTAVLLKVDAKTKFSALYAEMETVYDAGVFNADFFAPGEDARLTDAKAALGKFLFFDPILSANNQRACASCHKPELAFTDGNVRSLNFERGDLPRNAPTVINAAFQKAQFWDLRSGSLEDQLDSVINSPDEMHSNFNEVIRTINSSDEYKQMFYAAFPESKKNGIQRKHVKIAIASYERTLTGLNSRFDQYVRGDKSKLTESEISGFNVYMGKAKCGSCHYAPLFAGALPPYFEFTDHRSIGVPLEDSMKVYKIDADTGASKVFKNPFTHFSFKVPTVRNVELTAPYMHNGVFKTLEQVVDFYEDAGGVKFTKDMRPGMKGLPFFMIIPEKLNLTNKEKADLVAFMKALTDTSSARNIPTRLPELKGPYAYMNKRTIGGTY